MLAIPSPVCIPSFLYVAICEKIYVLAEWPCSRMITWPLVLSKALQGHLLTTQVD